MAGRYQQAENAYPWSFRNTEGSTMPAFSIAAITGQEFKDQELILKLAKPGTTFYRQLAISEPVDAAASTGYGRCLVKGYGLVKYDSGTPAAGEGWGPKPSQWTISKGFPGCTIVGIADSTNKIALVSLDSPIVTLLGKAIANLSADTSYSSTSDYKIYIATTGSEADGGFTTLPSIYVRVPIAKDKLFTIEWINNGWQVNAAAPFVCIGKTDSAVSAGSSGTVSIWTGTPGSESDSGDNITGVRNRTGVDIPTTKWVRVEYIYGSPYMEPWEC